MTSSHRKHLRLGFSLVEMSVVLVLVGLLVGAIVVGEGMIRASQLRSVATDANNYISAVQNFKTQYGGLPGDITNATNYWGIAAGTGSDATCYAFDATGTQATCNGNGDGRLSSFGVGEIYRAWTQLANAGLIQGAFSGTSPDTTSYAGSIPGVNTPKSRIRNAGYDFTFSGGSHYLGTYDDTVIGQTNLIRIGGYMDNTHQLAGNIFKCTEAYELDTKMDDGLPATGSWIASIALGAFTAAGVCVTSASSTDTTGTYVTTKATVGVSFMVQTGF